jgi:hypothetical protein
LDFNLGELDLCSLDLDKIGDFETTGQPAFFEFGAFEELIWTYGSHV